MTIMHRFRLLLLFALLTSAMPARAAEPAASDDFLKGYVAAVLERELGWAPGSFQVQVRNRVATVVINVDDPQKRELIEQTLSRIGGLEQIHVVVSSAAPSAENEPIVFPAGDLFRPLLADPRQPQFFVSFVKMTTPTDRITAASVGYGENFGLWRWPGANPGDGWQFNFAGGLFALFNLSAPSNDLVNGDYNVGFSLTHGAGPWSQRFRLYHQSSHLGDEFLLSQPNIKRINLSIEAVDAVTSYEGKRWRVYGGPGYLIGRDPPDLKPGYLQAGAEYRSQRFQWDLGRFVAGVDLKSYQEQHWNVARSIKAGLELGQADPGRRRVRVLAEYYAGSSPFGQFFESNIHYAGVGVYFGF